MLKNQFKKEDKSGAILTFVLGEDETENKPITNKSLREEKQQETIKQTELAQFFQTLLFSH